jgi:hypothetical protein
MIHKSKNVGRILSLTHNNPSIYVWTPVPSLVLPTFNKLGRNLILEQHTPKEFGLGQALKKEKK